MHLNVLTTDSAPSASRPLLEGIAIQLGFMPNLAGVAAASPTLLAAFDAVRRVVGEPDVPAVHREIAGVAVGVAVDTAYGVAFHSTMLAALGVDEPAIDAMRAGVASA
jgi:alkylhydroperoxidase family enzyme